MRAPSTVMTHQDAVFRAGWAGAQSLSENTVNVLQASWSTGSFRPSSHAPHRYCKSLLDAARPPLFGFANDLHNISLRMRCLVVVVRGTDPHHSTQSLVLSVRCIFSFVPVFVFSRDCRCCLAQITPCSRRYRVPAYVSAALAVSGDETPIVNHSYFVQL